MFFLSKILKASKWNGLYGLHLCPWHVNFYWYSLSETSWNAGIIVIILFCNNMLFHKNDSLCFEGNAEHIVQTSYEIFLWIYRLHILLPSSFPLTHKTNNNHSLYINVEFVILINKWTSCFYYHNFFVHSKIFNFFRWRFWCA